MNLFKLKTSYSKNEEFYFIDRKLIYHTNKVHKDKFRIKSNTKYGRFETKI